MSLITLEEATGHLHIDLSMDSASPPAVDDERYPDLLLKMAQAEAAVLDYIEMDEADLSASGVDPKWTEIVKAAMLLLLAGLWDDREGAKEGDYFVDNGAIARLLKRIRYPAIA